MPKDPYKYFRIEARELLEGLNQGVLDLEKGVSGKELVGRLLRFAHTLKGAARVVKLAAIAEQAHAVEDVLAPYREGQEGVPPEMVKGLLRLLDGVASRLAAIDPTTEPEATPARRAPEEPIETVRVEIEEMDLLLEGVTEATVQVTALRREGATIEQALQLARIVVEQVSPRRASGAAATNATALARVHSLAEELRGALERLHRSVPSGIEQVSTELMQVRDAANRLRLLPASSLFASLERAARDAADSVGKRISFHASGGDVRLDAHVLGAVRDALLHVVRNAAVHGIEQESDRTGAGKPAVGRIDLAVERRGARVAFTCKDDGRGIDVEALRHVAVRGGQVSAHDAARLSPKDVFGLLLLGGLSTTGTLTEVSGRGVGLDVVREISARLRGEVKIESEPRIGTRIELRVPVSLSSVSALVVESGGIAASVPLDAVRRTLRLGDSEIAHSSESDSIVYEGKVIPFTPLSSMLRRQVASPRGRSFSAIVVESGTGLAALGVDRLVGTANVVVRALPAHLELEPVVAGASLDAEGHPQLVLDPSGLVDAARAGKRASWTGAASPRRPILVVDDSLTTRMLEQSILESAGYEVDVAVSAEDALGKAAGKAYGLFVVDVEMPGMDGLEFVARTRADPALRETPAILVTSRGSDEDRRRGREAGARAYIVKGEFDQGHLLKTIRELTGES